MIKLAHDTINTEDIQNLISWLQTNPRLTQGEKVLEFEKQWSQWNGVKHSVFVNSGSSANLAMLAVHKGYNQGSLNVIAPCISWATTVAPIIQLGFNPILCDAEEDSLGVCPSHLEQLCEEYKPSALILVHVLGSCCKMQEIHSICDYYKVTVLEDSCETVGATFWINNKLYKSGAYGAMSAFSFYFGHHMSTIEGGMVCTNSDYLNNKLRMIRSHGWTRDLSLDTQRSYSSTDPFHERYTFYEAGFNIRGTDLQAHLGLGQLAKLDKYIEIRRRNYDLYADNISKFYWQPGYNVSSSNFAYPLVAPNKSIFNNLVEDLTNADIECRPLICGNINNQPFFKNYRKPPENFPVANRVHELGLYLPNHHSLSEEEVLYICQVVNKSIIWGG